MAVEVDDQLVDALFERARLRDLLQPLVLAIDLDPEQKVLQCHLAGERLHEGVLERFELLVRRHLDGPPPDRAVRTGWNEQYSNQRGDWSPGPCADHRLSLI